MRWNKYSIIKIKILIHIEIKMVENLYSNCKKYLINQIEQNN